jgi:hypothetical protein
MSFAIRQVPKGATVVLACGCLATIGGALPGDRVDVDFQSLCSDHIRSSAARFNVRPGNERVRFDPLADQLERAFG